MIQSPATPVLPAEGVDSQEAWREFAPAFEPNDVLWSEVIPGGCHDSWLVRRGMALSFYSLAKPGAFSNASVVLYAIPSLLERYNAPDTLKAQHTARLTQGHVLMSDMGRAMASIISDEVGWHDPLGLLLSQAAAYRRYGEMRYQAARNAMVRAGREGLLIEIGKYGLLDRDLIAPVNFFSKVVADEQGALHFDASMVTSGKHVTIRADMDLMVAVSTAPHPLAPGENYEPGDIGVVAHWVGLADLTDGCRNTRGETARAHHNTDLYNLAVGSNLP